MVLFLAVLKTLFLAFLPFAPDLLLLSLSVFAVTGSPLVACPLGFFTFASSFAFALASTGLNARLLLSLLCFSSVLVILFMKQEIHKKKLPLVLYSLSHNNKW
jgi:hypothetical protein